MSVMRRAPHAVLEEQATLLESYDEPLMRSYVSNFMESSRSTYHHQWLFEQGESADRFISNMQSALRRAFTYAVVPDMCDLVEWATAKLPEDHLKPEDLPTECGFAWFDKSYLMFDVRGRQTATRAVLWERKHERIPNDRLNDPAGLYRDHVGKPIPGVRITFFTHRDDPDDHIGQSIEVRERLLDKASPMHRLWEYPLQLEHSFFLPFGSSIHEAEIDPVIMAAIVNLDELPNVPSSNGSIVRWVFTFWKMLDQTITSLEDGFIPKTSRRRVGRMGLPAQVTVVELRRRERKETHEESHVEWHHRWIVRGYWQRKNYKDKETGEWAVKKVWIHPHLKGPEGKPLLQTEKVYLLKR